MFYRKFSETAKNELYISTGGGHHAHQQTENAARQPSTLMYSHLDNYSVQLTLT